LVDAFGRHRQIATPPSQWFGIDEGPVPYLRFGGLLGGWQEPQGVAFVTLSGVASVCPEVKVNAAPAINNAAPILDAHTTEAATCCIQWS
jgi:hypothetical protein